MLALFNRHFDSMTPAPQKKSAIVTIVSNNYLHFARTMLQSARRHHPDYSMYCVIVDRDQSHATAHSGEFESISIDKLNLPLGDEFLFQYNILELNTAVKPWAIEYLFERGYENVIYVDPDIYFYGHMGEVARLLAADTDIVLTPHLLAPVADDKQPRELDIRRAGAYNFGFCALRDSTNTRSFLRWWQAKLMRDCVNDADRGLFVDQSWIDLVPGLFDNVSILRHRGYNVAYWNIAQRRLVERDGKAFCIDHDPLIFFHFSGLDPANPEPLSKHQDRFTLSTVGPARSLVDEYVNTLMANGFGVYSKLEYGFGCFSNGENIPDVFRKLYRTSSALRARMVPQPFDCATVMASLWPELCIEGVSPTNAMMALWNERRDVQSEFPMQSAASILAFYHWFLGSPIPARYYSANLIACHAESSRRYDARAAQHAKRSAAALAKNWPGNEQRVHSLYVHLLNREADEGKFLQYSELCKTDAGFVRVWGEIGLSTESRRKPFLWFRMLKALLLSIRKVDRTATSKTNQRMLVDSPGRERNSTGIFPAEADIATQGVWITDTLVTAIIANPRDRIVLQGIYFPESIERQTGHPESAIRFLLGGEEIHVWYLSEHGEFTIACQVPDFHGTGPTNLTIESSKVFVPKHIGQGDDERRLALRMKVLSVGERRLFDCADEATYRIVAGPEPSDEELPGAPKPGMFHRTYTGLFQADVDSEINGVWASANVVVPVVPIEGEVIQLRGVYDRDSIAKQTGSGESIFRFSLGGREIFRSVLDQSGEFTFDFAFPPLKDSDGDQLHIQCSKSFVKKQICEGDDDRILSWRLKSLIAGRITVFDCARQNPATSNRRFVPRMTHTPDFGDMPVKLFALYFPQFSTCPPKNERWSARVVDWAEVANATAHYPDHHQPHLPVELGFYDYRAANVLKRQVALATQYGISGFCFQHVWAPGKQWVDQPLDRFLADTTLDIEFCVYWESSGVPGQQAETARSALSIDGSGAAFIDTLLPAFQDARYRTIDKKPVLLVRNDSSSLTREAIEGWRAHASHAGLPGLYIIAAVWTGEKGPGEEGRDAMVEFPPFGRHRPKIDGSIEYKAKNQTVAGRIYEYGELAMRSESLSRIGVPRFEAVMPSWDNEAIAPGAGSSFADATPEKYANWLADDVAATAQKRTEEQLIFIHAWNAWGEGAHLEADQRFGYGFLHATAAILLNHFPAQNGRLIAELNQSFKKRSDTVLIVHIFYEDLIDSLFDSYLNAAQQTCDLLVTVMPNATVASLRKIKTKFENCYIIETENRGRDIRPFVVALRKAHEWGYLYGCKIHTKKSLQRFDGDEWRTQLLESLLPDADRIEATVQRFRDESSLGMLVSKRSLHNLSEQASHIGNTKWLNVLLARMGEEKQVGVYNFEFSAGSMCWFRLAAVSQLLDERYLSLQEFELEAGQLDGTLAHAIERIIGLLPITNGLKLHTN